MTELSFYQGYLEGKRRQEEIAKRAAEELGVKKIQKRKSPTYPTTSDVSIDSAGRVKKRQNPPRSKAARFFRTVRGYLR
jgi:hypothetical protein